MYIIICITKLVRLMWFTHINLKVLEIWNQNWANWLALFWISDQFTILFKPCTLRKVQQSPYNLITGINISSLNVIC